MWYLTGKHKESNQDPELFFSRLDNARCSFRNSLHAQIGGKEAEAPPLIIIVTASLTDKVS